MKDKRGIYGKQIYFFSISIFLPILANIYNLSGLNNLGFDLTPLVFGISGLIIYFGIIKYQIFDMVPIARSYIVDQIKSGVVVTDRTGKIVDINKAGLKIFNFKNEEILGKMGKVVFNQYPELIRHCGNTEEKTFVFEVENSGELKTYQGGGFCSKIWRR
jgi:PAS domain-containing protein